MPAHPVLGVPLALTDYEQTLDWIDAAVAAARARLRLRRRRPHRDGLPGGPGAARRGARRRLHRARRPAARVGAARARPPARGPRVRARADGPRLRPRRAHRPALLPLRRPQPGRARRAHAHAAPAPPGPEDRRRLRAAVPRAHGRRGRRGRGRHRPLRRGRRVGRHRRAQAGEVDGADARPRCDAPVLVGVGAAFDFHAGLVPQAPARLQRCGLEWLFRLRAGAAPAVAALPAATTRASCWASRASTRATAALRVPDARSRWSLVTSSASRSSRRPPRRRLRRQPGDGLARSRRRLGVRPRAPTARRSSATRSAARGPTGRRSAATRRPAPRPSAYGGSILVFVRGTDGAIYQNTLRRRAAGRAGARRRLRDLGARRHRAPRRRATSTSRQGRRQRDLLQHLRARHRLGGLELARRQPHLARRR